jgi:hypothetical protein
MTPGQIIISFIIAAFVTAFFAGFLRAAGPWKGFWIFFIIIFVVTLAASEWVTPVGPTTYGYYWIPGLFVAVLFAILLAAVTPKGKNVRDKEKDSPSDKSNLTKIYYSPKDEPHRKIYQGDEPANTVALGGFFWIFISLLMLIVIIGAFI